MGKKEEEQDKRVNKVKDRQVVRDIKEEENKMEREYSEGDKDTNDEDKEKGRRRKALLSSSPS